MGISGTTSAVPSGLAPPIPVVRLPKHWQTGETGNPAVQDSHTLLLELFLLFSAAKLLGGVFARLRQPAAVGEIAAGILLGPSLLGFVRPN